MKKIIVGALLVVAFPIVVLIGAFMLAVIRASEYMDNSYRYGG